MAQLEQREVTALITKRKVDVTFDRALVERGFVEVPYKRKEPNKSYRLWVRAALDGGVPAGAVEQRLERMRSRKANRGGRKERKNKAVGAAPQPRDGTQ